MHDEAEVGLVEPHPERGRRDESLDLVAAQRALEALAIGGVGAKGPAPDGAAAARGQTGVAPQLRQRLLDALRTRLSARHVPNEVYAIPEVPRTMSGKKLEVPVRKILLGQPVEKSVNRDSMANPASIDWFVAFGVARANSTTTS